ncbi:Putative SH3 domain-containing protein [[Torrubiella] hemipterigena]|uniref:Putative SH3 domain-containing protein n=1 Tax=[Torrubiella] hemipterigena TaxID=1531966 RepID=A0A0A1T5J1_9HYPO|nr:Putative SH3 domain-containing protein [[Torrubiella] hemipterigena]
MPTLFRVKALFEYTSPHEDDLSFPVDQIIAVTEQDDDDWYGGEYLDDDGVKHEGIFPRNFVEKYEPAAPPRPSRARNRKSDVPQQEPEQEPAPVPKAVSKPPPPPAAEPEPVPEPEEAAEPEPEEEDEEEEPEAEEPAPVPVATRAVPPPPQSTSPKVVPTPTPAPAGAKPKAAAPPPAPEKPTSNSFKDRIAAFNRPDAAPVAPFKPGRLTGTDSFVKKPFVPPPPSRDAYVPVVKEKPAPKIYRREEDPEIRKQEDENLAQAEKAGLVPTEAGNQGAAEEDDDQPKPTSLKERIALLQKQQQEQAARHAEAAAKKPKKPPVKKRAEAPPVPAVPTADEEAAGQASEGSPLQRTTTGSTIGRASLDEALPTRSAPPPRPKAARDIAEPVHDGNEADMSGAGDTTEGQDDVSEREEQEEAQKPLARVTTGSSAISQRQSRPPPPAAPPAAPPAEAEQEAEEDDEQGAEEEEEEEEVEEDDVDPEVRRKEELRARMAKMSGGMGMHGMFGAIPPVAPVPKKKTPKTERAPVVEEQDEPEPVTRAAPPVPTPMAMALPGMGAPPRPPTGAAEDEDDEDDEPASRDAPRAVPPVPPVPSRSTKDAEDDEVEEEEALTPVVTGTTGAPPPIPSARPAPPPPVPGSAIKSTTEGSQSDDELSGEALERRVSAATRSPPLPPHSPTMPMKSPPLSPRQDDGASKRNSRPPPPIPGAAAPPPPPPASSRPPPPPPPGAPDEEEEEEYEGDYDTDIASSVPHKDALKAHAGESDADDTTLQSPAIEQPAAMPPPLPPTSPPRAAPPPRPQAAAPPRQASVELPRAAPPPPPPGPPTVEEPPAAAAPPVPQSPAMFASQTPTIGEEGYFPGPSPSLGPSEPRRSSTIVSGARGAPRQSGEVARSNTTRRSVDAHRPPADSGFIANDIDLALHSGWWKQSNQLPPALQGRRDIFFESEESTTTNQGSKTQVTRDIFVLYQDYSQTILKVHYDPYDPNDVEVDQHHEPPPRPLRQDEMEEFYDRFGRQLSEAATSKKDSIVADGTPMGLVLELLKPLNGALAPIGTRAFGALVYANMANASTQQNDVIRPGDIISVRNAKFQGKHGAMHAKYTAEVGKPDHVGIVAEWDGTKKKVRVWEQGRENKKVKQESFKLDDLRSGEVKIWRVVPRSWVGWNSQS